MVVLGFCVLAHPAYRLDAVEERGEFDRATQGALAEFPAIEFGQCGLYLVIRQHSHVIEGIPFAAVLNPLPNLIVVAGALIQDAALLVAQRARPPELAGLWELPGGKVASGETDAAALAREMREELGIGVAVGARLGADVALSATSTLRAYLVTHTDGVLQPHDHRELRWVVADELDHLPWVPADTAWLPQLAMLLR